MKLSPIPSVLTVVLSLAAGTLLAQAPSFDVDAVTPTAVAVVTQDATTDVATDR